MKCSVPDVIDDVEPGAGIFPMPISDGFEVAGGYVTVAQKHAQERSTRMQMLLLCCCRRTSFEHLSFEQSLLLTPENGGDTSFPWVERRQTASRSVCTAAVAIVRHSDPQLRRWSNPQNLVPLRWLSSDD